jgi:outer membrane protein TolC
MEIRNFLLIATFLGVSTLLQAQDTLKLTLEQTIDRALSQSLMAQENEVARENAHWDWLLHKSNYRPQLVLTGELPNYTSSIEPVVQNDGNLAYRQIEQHRTTGALQLEQPIPFLGGSFYISSQWQRFDNLQSSDLYYQAIPIQLGLNIPILGYKALKWQKRIQPLKYHEDLLNYDQQTQLTAQKAVNLYFQLLYQQSAKLTATNNLSVNQRLYTLGSQKHEMGLISKDELLQLKMLALKAQQTLSSAQVSYDEVLLTLKTFLKIPRDMPIQIGHPSSPPTLSINEEEAINRALQNNPASIEIKRKLLEAKANVAYAKGQTGAQLHLRANLGYTNDFNTLENWNQHMQNYQKVSLSFAIPILDWGRTKSRISQAEIARKLVTHQVEQEKEQLIQAILVHIASIKSLGNQLETARMTQITATKRYQIAQNRYAADDLSVWELQLAQQENEAARQNHLQTLSAFWIQYYQLRILTLYDFAQNETLLTKKNEIL